MNLYPICFDSNTSEGKVARPRIEMPFIMQVGTCWALPARVGTQSSQMLPLENLAEKRENGTIEKEPQDRIEPMPVVYCISFLSDYIFSSLLIFLSPAAFIFSKLETRITFCTPRSEPIFKSFLFKRNINKTVLTDRNNWVLNHEQI